MLINAIFEVTEVILKMIKKIKARRAVYVAVRSGRLKKPDKCEVCQEEGKISGHHWHGYENPLDVLWTCPRCHHWHERCVKDNKSMLYIPGLI